MKVMEMRDAWGVDHIKPGTRPDRTPGAGEVRVEIAPVADRLVRITVSDTGIGIPSADSSRR